MANRNPSDSVGLASSVLASNSRPMGGSHDNIEMVWITIILKWPTAHSRHFLWFHSLFGFGCVSVPHIKTAKMPSDFSPLKSLVATKTSGIKQISTLYLLVDISWCDFYSMLLLWKNTIKSPFRLNTVTKLGTRNSLKLLYYKITSAHSWLYLQQQQHRNIQWSEQSLLFQKTRQNAKGKRLMLLFNLMCNEISFNWSRIVTSLLLAYILLPNSPLTQLHVFPRNSLHSLGTQTAV